MSQVSRVLLAAFACTTFSATSFAGGPFGTIHVGKWQGAAYTTDKGAFSHCTAAAPLSLLLTFDNQAKFEIAAVVGAKKVVGGVLPAQALAALRKARSLAAIANKRTLQFDLAAAGNVVPSIENCVEQINTNGIASAGDFSHPKAKPSTASARSDSTKSDSTKSDSTRRRASGKVVRTGPAGLGFR